MNIENVFLEIQSHGKANSRQCRDATREYLRINLYHLDFYFIVAGMALMVFATRSFSDHSIDYGPWRPLVISLAAIMAGIIPMLVSVFLYPFHLIMRVNIWVLTVLNALISANIFAYVEPVIPNYFYSEGVLSYKDLIFGILVFYMIALLYLQLRLNKYVCLNRYWDRHDIHDINSLIPADKRGEIVALYAQDHYVNITTDKGEHLHRMSMKEAMEMIPENTGLQVHRSHWVAFSAIGKLQKISDKYHLNLRNGAQIPVSRAKISDLRKYLSHD